MCFVFCVDRSPDTCVDTNSERCRHDYKCVFDVGLARELFCGA